MSDLSTQLSKLARENNVKKLRDILSKRQDEGRPFLKKFVYSLGTEPIEREYKNFPRNNLHLLHVAAYYDSFETFLYIINKGINMNVKSPDEYFPLHYACIGGSIEVASFILSRENIEIEQLNYAPIHHLEYTPIYLATLAPSADIITILLNAGAPLNTSDNVAKPIHAAIRLRNAECIKILLSNTNTSRVDEKNFTPVMKAISSGFGAAVPMLVEAGGDILYVTPDGKSALYLACSIKDEKMVTYLLDNGADPTCRGFMGQYPIHWAAASDNVNIVKAMIDHGADPNVVDSRGRPPTFSAIMSDKNKDQILKILLDAGCDPNAVQKTTGATILSSLIIMEPKKTILNSIRYVLEAGADLNLKQKNKLTIYQSIQRLHNPAVLKLVDDFLKEKQEENS